MTTPAQRNASRPEQVNRGRHVQHEIERRRKELWYRLLTGQLTAAEAREFVSDVLLADVGVLQPIDLDLTPHQLAARVARNNLGVKWLRQDVAQHPVLYRQMQEEAEKRSDDRRRALEAVNATPEVTE